MQAEINARPSFAHLRVRLDPGETIIAESGAMASMSGHTQLTAQWNGGFINALIRRYLGGESLFVNEVACPAGAPAPAEIVITQPTPGDIMELKLNGTSMCLQKGAFIAATTGVILGVAWAGFASWIGGEGLFRLKVSGNGSVWFGGYGAIVSREITEELIVDSGHLIAYEPTVSLSARLSGGIFSSFFGGEGLVTALRGPGRVYLQTRAIQGLAAWTNGFLG
jgi:uncharacterized protein (TIGR00266 family)